MAKFVNTKKAVSAIEDLIKDSGEKLILISPYLKLSKDFKELLAFRNSKDKVTTVIFGKQELNPDEMKFLQGLRFVILKYNEDLHAKCYASDDQMIITSLNLYAFSMANNKEMGVFIQRNDPADAQLFEDAMKEVDFINQTSQKFEFGLLKPIDMEKGSTSRKKTDSKNTGFCIRTGVEIPFNLDKPLSYDAFKSWNKYANPKYPEKFCHFFGESSRGETCVNNPVLKKNLKLSLETFRVGELAK